MADVVLVSIASIEDALALVDESFTVLLVARRNFSKKDEAERAVLVLRQAEIRAHGVVITDANRSGNSPPADVLLRAFGAAVEQIAEHWDVIGKWTRRFASTGTWSRRSSTRARTAPGTTKAKVLGALSTECAMTAGDVAQATGLARGTVSSALSKLAKTGEINKAERGYRLPAPR
jgi:DNA-binding transcriptional ArsR family regulator